MPANLEGLDGSFRQKVEALVAASGGRVTIVSGFRTNEEQAALVERAKAKHGDDWRKWAAPPGQSNHNKGFAVDLGGDLKLAARLAPQFGLYFPMKHEPWHIEPVGSREGTSQEAWTPNPTGEPNGDPHDVGYQLASLMKAMSLDTEGFESPDIGATRRRTGEPVAGKSGGGLVAAGADGDTLNKLMAALRRAESGGNYRVRNSSSSASGAYQYLRDTWAGFGGYAEAWQAPPEVQDAKARSDLARKMRDYGGDVRKVVQSWFYPAQAGNDAFVPPGNDLSLGAYADRVLGFM